MKVLFLVPYPLDQAPSQRFRFEQYFTHLKRNGIQYHVNSFLTIQNWQLFFKRGNIFAKVLAVFRGFMCRIAVLFRIFSYDFVFIHREATPIGPPIIEWLIRFVFRRKIIYDFDDAIWLTDRVSESWLLTLLKWRTKVASICRWSYKVSCGNKYLCEYAGRYNARVIYNPTTIDTHSLHNPSLFKPRQSDGALYIGWTGSRSTLKYLKDLEPVLKELQRKYDNVHFLVIADHPPDLNLERLEFRKWSIDSEIIDLAKLDIGIMPLPDDMWTIGKCGFKALQYMALEIPTVASPVGVNKRIISHGENGFLARSPEEWQRYLQLLIDDHEIRKSLGKIGRETVLKHYSVEANQTAFLSLFEVAQNNIKPTR